MEENRKAQMFLCVKMAIMHRSVSIHLTACFDKGLLPVGIRARYIPQIVYCDTGHNSSDTSDTDHIPDFFFVCTFCISFKSRDTVGLFLCKISEFILCIGVHHWKSEICTSLLQHVCWTI